MNFIHKLRPARWLLVICIACSIVSVAFPMFVMRPFVQQKPALLMIALAIERWAPWLTLIYALAGAVLAVRSWARRPERFIIPKNIFMVIGVAVLVWAAVVSRVNLFERMFHPIRETRFVSASQAALDPKEMVMAVRVGNEARAYPVLQMAYHHVVNDVIGNEPIVATY